MKNSGLKEVALVFFKMGLVAFGGPAAHIAMMEDEIIKKRKWMSREKFLDLVGATNLIPGPNSTEMTMHCGYERAGWAGLFTAGICFIFPAVVLTGILAWLFVNYGELPSISPFIYGIKPAILALIASAIFKLGKKALKNTTLMALGVLALIVCLLGVNEVSVLLLTGFLWALFQFFKHKKYNAVVLITFLSSFANLSNPFTLKTLNIFFIFLKVGSVLYGSGYVLFAYLDAELVNTGWMTRTDLMDAIAVGQFTPGPVLSTATFVGYQIGGLWGAVAATLGIFLPSFLFVLVLNPLIPKMRQSFILSHFLDAVNVAAVAVMAAVLLKMGNSILLNDWRAVVIAIIGFLLVFLFKKTNAILLVLGGSALGYLLQLIS